MNQNAYNTPGERVKELQWNSGGQQQQGVFFVEEKKKFAVNGIIKDARKDTRLTTSSSHQVLGEKKILRKLQL